MSQIKNPWWAILLVPLVVFLALMTARTNPDYISLPSRLYAVALIAIVGARYVGRAPVLMWQGNMSPEARNVVGWGMVLLALLLTQAYAWLFISMGRPEWLQSSYWPPGFVILACVGLTMVASSLRRVPPHVGPPNGLSVLPSLLVGLFSAGALFLIQFAPMIWKGILALVMGAVHAI